MSNDAQRIDLPSGDVVWYVDETHAYYRHNPETGKKGRRATGVTTVVKTLDLDPSALLRWAARTQLLGVAELAAADGGDLEWLDTQESIQRALEDNRLTFEDIRDQAAKRGTQVHEVAFQALGMGREVPDLDALTDEERGHAHAIMAFWLDHNPEAQNVEQIVFSERLGVAGRLDFLGTVSPCDDERCACREFGGLGVIDAKTGRFISAGAHVQVGGGYPLLAEESGFGTAEWAMILQTAEDGTYNLMRAQGTREHFEVAVAAYRAAGQVNLAAKKAREAVAA